MIKVVYFFFLFLIIVNCSIDYSSNIFRKKTKQKVSSNVSNLSVSVNDSFKVYKNKLLNYSKNNKFPNINKWEK